MTVVPLHRPCTSHELRYALDTAFHGFGVVTTPVTSLVGLGGWVSSRCDLASLAFCGLQHFTGDYRVLRFPFFVQFLHIFDMYVGPLPLTSAFASHIPNYLIVHAWWSPPPAAYAFTEFDHSDGAHGVFGDMTTALLEDGWVCGDPILISS
jgi:hypothetical protein